MTYEQTGRPFISGSLLRHIDSHFSGRDEVFYARYMDDFIFFTRTRWHLRRAIRSLHDFFDLGGFDTHPDKTQIGKIEQGFDWLGIWYARDGPRIAPRAEQNHRERLARLYEQARYRKLSGTETEALVREYEARWRRWAVGILSNAQPPDDYVDLASSRGRGWIL